jgi:hypothetical protein
MQIPPYVVCPVCDLRNEVTARFCRDCGLPLGAPRDPVRGTTTRRADLPSDRGAGVGAVLSLVAIVVIAGLALFLVFRGFDTGGTIAGATATPTAVSGGPRASLPAMSPGGDPLRPSRDPGTTDPGSTEVPTPDPGDEPTDEPTEGPTDEPNGEPGEPTSTPLSTITRWTCDDSAIQDPLGGRWRITQARWSREGAYDRLVLVLARTRGSSPGARIAMAFLRPARAADLYGVSRPTGERALVLSFDRPITLRAPMDAQPGLPALASLETIEDEDGLVHMVIGIQGDGCVRMSGLDWRDGSDLTTSAEIVIDFRR